MLDITEHCMFNCNFPLVGLISSMIYVAMSPSSYHSMIWY